MQIDDAGLYLVVINYRQKAIKRILQFINILIIERGDVMKNITVNSKAGYFLACITGLVFILSACSSDDAAQVIADEFVNISGTITTSIPGDEVGVAVKGIYSDNDPLNPSTTTGAGGVFSLPVLKNRAVSVQASKAGFATLNSAKEEFSVNEPGANAELPTTAEAEGAILTAFGAGPTLAGQAWLAVDVLDANTGDDIAGIAISTTGTPVGVVFTTCTGGDSGLAVTVVDDVPCNRDGPMYFAYFDTDSTEVTVSDGTTQQLAPVRRGEVTFLEFEQ